MSQLEIGIIGVVILIVLLLLGVHIGFLLIIIGLAGYAFIAGFNASINNLAIQLFDKLNSYHFAVIPLYMLMSEFIGRGGIGRDAYEAARAWLGKFKGGLAMATIGACGLFACVSGSSLAGSIVMGRVAYPEMKRLGYHDGLSSAAIACGGTLGILIPPSMAFVLIGILADLSIGKLFLAGILPGIVTVIFYVITISIVCKRNPSLAPGSVTTTLKEKVFAVRLTWSIFLLFFLIMGGMYSGIFTASEAAGIGAFGAMIISFGKGQMKGKQFWEALFDSTKMTGMIMIMVVGAYVFNSFLVITQLPFSIGTFLVSLHVSKYVVLAFIIIFYIIMGMFFEIYAILIITIPILFPAMKLLGFDLIWYSVIMVRVTEVGFISPPFGINVFALSGIIKVPIGTIFRGVLPFWASDMLNIIFLSAFPIISTWLPSMM